MHPKKKSPLFLMSLVVETNFKKTFAKDLHKLRRQKQILQAIEQLILQVQEAESLESIPHLKKMEEYTKYYRVRIGDYRVGIFVEDDIVTFVRCLHRRDVYRYFPT